MKIGDEVYVHVYVDEIRKDTVIVKNKGGYFGTSKKEISSWDEWSSFEFPANKFAVLVSDNTIRVINTDKLKLSVTVEETV